MACTGRTADAVHIVFRNVRQFEVHNVRQAINIKSARREIGCYQHTYRAAFEVVQGTCTCRLRFVAVYGRRRDAVGFKLGGKTIGTVLGTHEDQDLLPVLGADAVRQELALAILVDPINESD